MQKQLPSAFEKVYLTIEFNEANNWIYNNWVGVLPRNKAIQGAQATIDFLREYNCPNMLNDNRQVIGSWKSANDWIAETWVPQVLALGLKRLAFVVSPGIFGQASAVDLSTRIGNRLEMRLFQDIEAAKAWLRST